KPKITPLLFQYKDFVAWQKNFLQSVKGNNYRQYWMKRLKGLNLPLKSYSKDYSNEEKTEVLSITKSIEGSLFQDLSSYVKNNNLTIPVILLGTFDLLVYKLTNENDITIQTQVSG